MFDYLRSLGADYGPMAQSFKRQGITGPYLLGIKHEDELKDDFQIHDRPIRRTIWMHIEKEKAKNEQGLSICPVCIHSFEFL